MSESSPRAVSALCHGSLALGVAVWLFGWWLGPRETALRLHETLLFDYQVYRDQLLCFGDERGALSSRWYYPPFAAVLLWPLRAAEPGARWGYALLQLALVLLLCRSCHAVLDRLPRRQRLAAAIGFNLCCYPLLSCLALGQLSLLLTVLALHSLAARRQSMAFLGAAAAAKLYPLLYAIGLGVRLELRPLVRLSGWLVLLGLIVPLGWLGPTRTLQLLEVALSVAGRTRGPRFDNDQTLEAWVMRLWYARSQFDAEPDALIVQLPQAIAFALSLIAGVTVLAYALWRTRRLPAHDPLTLAAVLLAVTLLIKPGWPHYFVVLPYAQAALLSRVQRARDLSLCALSVLASALPLVALVRPAALDALQSWGVVTLATLCALMGVCELAGAAELRPDAGAVDNVAG